MQRKRDSLIPISEVMADLPGPVQALREVSPQALYHFTRFDQVNQLVGPVKRTPISASWRG